MRNRGIVLFSMLQASLTAFTLAAGAPNDTAVLFPDPVSARASAGPIEGELSERPMVRELFRDVLRAGGFSHQTAERAAFIVREPNGSYRCQLWPATRRYKMETFRGQVPQGVVAVVHTHPNQFVRPSPEDVNESRRIGIPFYVLTLLNIYRIDPFDGKSTAIVSGRNWQYHTVNENQAACADNKLSDLLGTLMAILRKPHVPAAAITAVWEPAPRVAAVRP